MKNILTIPNALSAFRILLVPFIAILTNNGSYTAAGIMVLISGMTDAIDGFIARRFNQVSTLGKALDPIADYLTQIVITFCIAKRHPIVMLLFIILIIKQVIMGIGGLLFINKSGTTFSARWWGKLATIALFATMAIILLFPDMSVWLITGLTIVCAALTLFSVIKYMALFKDAFAEKNRKGLK